MNAWEFMSESPFVTMLLAYMACEMTEELWQTVCRSLNIWLRGWPPVHCDVDGDFRPQPDGETA